MILGATGHRPAKLGGYGPQTRLALGGLATDYLHRAQPDGVIVGMALGWDMAVAGACVAIGIPFTAAVPFDGQERRWPEEAQQRYRRLLAHAAEVVFVSPYPGARAMQQRNEWMVDRADEMIALWDGSWGGTFNCIQYATRKGVPVTNLWHEWSLPEEVRALL